jgi:hypothetical protein
MGVSGSLQLSALHLWNFCCRFGPRFKTKRASHPDQQRITFTGKQLKNRRTLSDYNIKMEVIVKKERVRPLVAKLFPCKGFRLCGLMLLLR